MWEKLSIKVAGRIKVMDKRKQSTLKTIIDTFENSYIYAIHKWLFTFFSTNDFKLAVLLLKSSIYVCIFWLERELCIGWGQGRGYESWDRALYVILDLYEAFLGQKACSKTLFILRQILLPLPPPNCAPDNVKYLKSI